MTLLEFVPQCCDASIYLKIGKHCAEQGICYNGLRPMGAVYWFSLPYRFGLPPASLMIGHYLLLGISVILSVIAANSLQRRNFSVKPTGVMVAVLLLCSLVIHLIFLFPVLRTSLSDAPAALLALMGTWLLLLSPEGIKKRITTISLAGLMFGMAAWLRAFYLYPVLLGLGLWLLIAPWKEKNSWVHLFVLSAMIPIGAQYHATFNASHKISYLEPETSSAWSESHLDSTITGYDTILPFDYHTWYAPCKDYSSPLRAIQTIDFQSMACVLAGRIYFYLGSYSAHPYLPPFEHELPDTVVSNFNPLTTEEITDSRSLKNITIDNDEKIKISDDENNQHSIMAQKIRKPLGDESGSVTQKVFLERGNTYEFRLSLWSKNDLHNIEISIVNFDQKKIMAHTGALVIPTEKPMVPNYSITKTKIDQSGLYEIIIASNKIDQANPIFKAARENGFTINTGTVYAWDAQLIKKSYKEPSSRTWSDGMFALNIMAILMALVTLIVLIHQKDIRKVSACFIPLFCFAISIAIVPEQRFIIFPLIFAWWLGIIMLIQLINQRLKGTLKIL